MKVTRFRRLCLSGLIGLLLVILTTCASNRSESTTPTPVESLVQPLGITLIFWHAWPSPEQHALATLVDRYNQDHPLTQVMLQAMPVASLTRELRMASQVGSGPHLVLLQSHTITGLARDEVLLALDGETLADVVPDDDLLSTAMEGVWASDQAGNRQVYGVPLAFDTLGLYYNKRRVEVPPKDTDALLRDAHALTNPAQQPPVWGLAYTLSVDKTVGYLPAFGGQVLDTNGQVVLGASGRAGSEQWLTWLLQLRQDEAILAIPDSITVESVLQAQAALITIDWSRSLPQYRALWGDDLGVALLPRVAQTNQAAQPYVQSDVLSINRQSVDAEEQAAALDFMRYLLSVESQQLLLEAGRQPTRLSLNLEGTTVEMEAARVFREQAQQGLPMPHLGTVADMAREEIERMQITVLRGLATPADAVTQSDAALHNRLPEAAISPQPVAPASPIP
ncbi:MAG: extracellular solute-binding protein [Chloroflexaceae bacterium]|nr:extracellular solute-binding protein [Chloroflexaceae bacterium]